MSNNSGNSNNHGEADDGKVTVLGLGLVLVEPGQASRGARKKKRRRALLPPPPPPLLLQPEQLRQPREVVLARVEVVRAGVGV